MNRIACWAAILAAALASGCGASTQEPIEGGGGSGAAGGSGGAGGTAGHGGAGGTGGTGGAGATGGSGGSTTQPEEEVAAVQVELGPDQICGINPCGTFGKGHELLLVARVVDKQGQVREDIEVRWSSSNEAAATVDGGLVYGVSAGTATITAEAGSNDVQGTYLVRVLPGQVMSIEVVEQDITLAAGESVTLTAIARDEDGAVLDDVTFSWEMGNPLVATVDQSGRVTGVRQGPAVVLVGADRGTATGWTAIEVTSGEPMPAPFGLDRITAGGATSCGLTPDGTAYCWGYNHFGEMGVGRQDPATIHFPVPEAVHTDLRFRSLHLGLYASCGVGTDDYVYCWGSNDSGRLGISLPGDNIGGTTVPAPMLGGTVQQLSLGGGHTCAISTDGDTYCWGYGGDGALGHGGTESKWVPEPVAGDHTFTRVVAGMWHTCALDDQGKAWCWGSNELGQLGNGAQRDGVNLGELAIPAHEPTAVVGDHTFVAIHGVNHTCGLTAAGEVFCWGNNQTKQIAPSEEGWEITTPRQIPTDLRFVDVQAGAHHTCGLTADGDAWCWGTNFSGQLGDGTMMDSLTPVKVKTELKFSAISIGSSVSCGIAVSGGAFCWGSSYTGEAGSGFTPGYSPFPWPVAHPAPVTETPEGT